MREPLAACTFGSRHHAVTANKTSSARRPRLFIARLPRGGVKFSKAVSNIRIGLPFLKSVDKHEASHVVAPDKSSQDSFEMLLYSYASLNAYSLHKTAFFSIKNQYRRKVFQSKHHQKSALPLGQIAGVDESAAVYRTERC